MSVEAISGLAAAALQPMAQSVPVEAAAPPDGVSFDSLVDSIDLAAKP